MADGWPAGKELAFEPPPEQGRTKQYIDVPSDKEERFVYGLKGESSDEAWRRTDATMITALTGINLTEDTAREAIKAMRKAGVCFFIPKV